MANTITIVFTSNPSTEPVEFPHPNTGVYVTGTQAAAGGPWQAVFTGVTKGSYSALTGRLKNYPAIAATIAASGPVLNNVLSTPVGQGSTPTSTSSVNVVVNSTTNNAGGYRLLAADAAAGPFTQIYVGASASFSHTGLTTAQTKYYQWQYVGGGFYDDSPVGSVFSGQSQGLARRVIAFGNSVTWGQSTYNYPERARNATALASRISFSEVMADGLASNNVDVIGYGYPGKRTDELNQFIASAITPNLDFTTYSTITVLVSELINSLLQSKTVAQTQADMIALINAIKAVDSRIKIDYLAATPVPTLTNSNGATDADLVTLNNYFKSVVGTTVNRYIDVRSVPPIGNFTAGYFFDTIHPNAYGYYAMAAIGIKAYLQANYTTTIITMPEFTLPATPGPTFTTQDDVANTATFGAGGFLNTDLIYSTDNGTTLTILPPADLASNVITIPVGDVALAAGAVQVYRKYKYDAQPISPIAKTATAFTQAAVPFDYTRFAFFLKSYAGGSTSALWKDLSGKAQDATQVNAGFVLTANQANGKAGYLASNATVNSVFQTILPASPAGNLTMYMAVRPDATNEVFAALLPSNTGITYLGINSPQVLAVNQGGVAQGAINTVAAAALVIITWRLRAGSTVLRINGVVKQSNFTYIQYANAGTMSILNQSSGAQLVGAAFAAALRIGDETDAQVTATEQLIASELGIVLG